MKRGLILFLIMFLFCSIRVNASENYFLWHNSIDSSSTTSYDGMLSDELEKYQNDTIESLGNKTIKLNNFNAYDVTLYEDSIWQVSGDNKIDFISLNNNNSITLNGDGTLKLQEIAFGLEERVSFTTPLLEDKVKEYINGNYILSIEDNYIVLQLKEIEEAKNIFFENKGFDITIKSNAKVPKDTVFIVENKLEDLKEEVSKKLENEEVEYIYDFRLEDNFKTVFPKEEVEVNIKLPRKEYIVYYYNDENKLEKVDSFYEDDCLKFNTTHFSQYVISSLNLNEVITEKEEEKEDNTILICISILAISIIIFTFVLLTGRHKKALLFK